MLKKILCILAVLLALGYIVFAAVTYSDKDSDVRCREVMVVVKDSAEHQFVHAAEIRNILKQKHIKIVGKRLKDIDYTSVEAAATSHKLVRRAECYSTPSGLVYINVWQHVPVIRIMSEYGNYYLNQDGEKTGLSPYSAADVVVATGNIKDSMTIERLYKMSLLLREDSFWNAQIEQIQVEPNGDWILIPRVGDYEILLGLPNEIEDKMKRLRLFYQEGLSKVGWERYSNINLKFENQIVCTKKE
jgi:cell division protein FtsQ